MFRSSGSSPDLSCITYTQNHSTKGQEVYPFAYSFTVQINNQDSCKLCHAVEHINGQLYVKAVQSKIILYHIHSDINDWGHFVLITCINAMWEKSYFCSDCDIAPNNSSRLRCNVWDNICGHNGCVSSKLSSTSTNITCESHCTHCRSESCFEAHKTRRGRKTKCSSM